MRVFCPVPMSRFWSCAPYRFLRLCSPQFALGNTLGRSQWSVPQRLADHLTRLWIFPNPQFPMTASLLPLTPAVEQEDRHQLPLPAGPLFSVDASPAMTVLLLNWICLRFIPLVLSSCPSLSLFLSIKSILIQPLKAVIFWTIFHRKGNFVFYSIAWFTLESLEILSLNKTQLNTYFVIKWIHENEA